MWARERTIQPDVHLMRSCKTDHQYRDWCLASYGDDQYHAGPPPNNWSKERW